MVCTTVKPSLRAASCCRVEVVKGGAGERFIRHVAKNIVASGIARKCEVQLAYAIGVAQPVSILVNTYGTGKLSDEEITEIVKKNFDLRPAAIIKNFDLKRPIYKQVAAYGHFGRTDLDLPWEKLDMVDVFKERV